MKPTQVRECSRKLTKLTDVQLRNYSRRLSKVARDLQHTWIQFDNGRHAKQIVRCRALARQLALAIYASPRPPRRQKAKA